MPFPGAILATLALPLLPLPLGFTFGPFARPFFRPARYASRA
jgi:hypothetical protein